MSRLEKVRYTVANAVAALSRDAPESRHVVVSHLEENLAAAGLILGDAEFAAIGRAA